MVFTLDLCSFDVLSTVAVDLGELCVVHPITLLHVSSRYYYL